MRPILQKRERAKTVFKRVVTEPALYGHLSIIFKQLGQSGGGERIILALSNDGINADGVLGATVFDALFNAPVTLVPPDAGLNDGCL